MLWAEGNTGAMTMSSSTVTERQVSVSTQAETLPALKRVMKVRAAPGGHWVGDGFPVKTMFSYSDTPEISPFILMDYAGPKLFSPSATRRGVGEHPHRGFETVTIVYSGEVDHRDSGGNSGRIGPGDVQWMTAGSGVVHEEMHSREFTERGGVFEAIQLWVNLPARHKMTAPRYQTILSRDIAEVALPEDAGTLRVIAGRFGDVEGPAKTFSPVELWQLALKPGTSTVLNLPSGHAGALFAMKGNIRVNGAEHVRETEFVVLDREGEGIQIATESGATVLILGGEPIGEPVAGYGPFVMNTEGEIRQAIVDYQSGRMGHLGPQKRAREDFA
jgi:redox-sensitive bicupin YhaK (pirin superfamily)